MVTTALELVGVLLLVVAVGLAIAPLSVPAALAACGALLICVSWVVERRNGSTQATDGGGSL